MPKAYENVRDKCIESKKKKKGYVTKKDIQECKKWAAIWYFKKFGKPVKHTESTKLYRINSLADFLEFAEIASINLEDIDILLEVEGEESMQDSAEATHILWTTANAVTDIHVGNSLEAVGLKNDYIDKFIDAINKSGMIKTGGEDLVENLSKQPDLLYLTFKLVHAGGNLNKDYFPEEELENAKYTPILKPLSFEHGGPNIGHIYYSEFIPETDQEPAYLKCAAVVYKYKYPKEAQAIAKRYENDDLYVSMEVFFSKFECSECHKIYDLHIDSHPILCEHLANRFNAGSQTYRILHDLLFAGAAIVENPADVMAEVLSVANDKHKSRKEDNTLNKQQIQKAQATQTIEQQKTQQQEAQQQKIQQQKFQQQETQQQQQDNQQQQAQQSQQKQQIQQQEAQQQKNQQQENQQQSQQQQSQQQIQQQPQQETQENEQQKLQQQEAQQEMQQAEDQPQPNPSLQDQILYTIQQVNIVLESLLHDVAGIATTLHVLLEEKIAKQFESFANTLEKLNQSMAQLVEQKPSKNEQNNVQLNQNQSQASIDQDIKDNIDIPVASANASQEEEPNDPINQIAHIIQEMRGGVK